MTAARIPRQRTAPGVADITRISPPAAAPRQPDVQGALALDFDPDTPGPRPAGLSAVPDRRGELERFIKRFCPAVVEVIAGDRGPAQLLRMLDERVYDDLVRRGRALAGIGGTDERLHRPRAQVRSVRVFCPCPDVAEFGIHVRHGERSRAVAGRLERRDGMWICVALQFG